MTVGASRPRRLGATSERGTGLRFGESLILRVTNVDVGTAASAGKALLLDGAGVTVHTAR